MTSQGTVRLRSGQWDWTLRPQRAGVAVVYHHRRRVSDELRAWSPEAELTQDGAADLALDPLERIWSDPDGIVWRIHVELPSDWGRQKSGNGKETVLLVFSYGTITRMISVPADLRVGDLTNLELIDLFRDSH
ncbi:MAG: hypothetical protein WD737_06530 [Gemmatimonadota bacterium]